MSNYNSLKATINANIKTNGNQEITGSVLNSVLNAMVTTIGAGYQYAGVATPSANPGSPDNLVFYLAATAGTYTHFGGIVVNDGEIAILRWDSSWHKDSTNAATKSSVDALREGVVSDGIALQKFAYSTFTAQTPSIHVDRSLLQMSQVGDYVEIKVNANGTSGAILRRDASYNQPMVKYSSSNTLQIRFTQSANFTSQNGANWNSTQVIKIVVEAVSGTTFTYGVYLDGVKIGTQDATAFLMEYIGYNSVMTLYYIKSRIGGVESTLIWFAQMTGAVGVTDVTTPENVPSLSMLDTRVSALEGEVDALQDSVYGEQMYYKYRHASILWYCDHDFQILQRVKGNIYLLTCLVYYRPTSTSAIQYPKGYWRIERSNLVSFVNGVATLVQEQVLTPGENEFVMQWLDGTGYNFESGFSGGWHLGETIENLQDAWVEFIIDGNRLNPTEDIPWTPCKSFKYRENSAIYQHNNDTIAAWHLKETEFKDGGYETINDLKVLQALSYFAYCGIVCVSRWLSQYAMPENVPTITDMGTGTPLIPEQFKGHGNRIHYEGNGYMCDVDSEVQIGADDSACQLVVYNSTQYNKYYRRNPDTPGDVNNRLKSRTKVVISAM